MLEIKNILFPFDLREASFRLFPYVQSVSQKYNSIIRLLHVIEDISKWGGFYLPHISLELYQQEAEKAAEKIMEKICAQKLNGETKIKKTILSGDPGTVILRTIQSEPIDLVIMGTHAYKGLERMTFGSVAEKIVKESPSPVMVINPYRLK